MAYIPGRGKSRRPEPEAEKPPVPERPNDLDLLKLQEAYRELEAAHQHIREFHIEMILNLAIAAEYKDPDTGNHILRISDYATELAREIKLPEDQVEILKYAAPMHDIGKIGIPDSILKKAGKLNEEEWETMKQHTVIGCRMFQNSRSPLLKSVSQIALTHHERFDGTGYPYGTKGQNIPLFGRVIAVVDIFDALVSARCYKEAWSYEASIAHVKSLAGGHLDPELVKAFVSASKPIRMIYDANMTIQQYVREFSEKSEIE
jgi:putative two-component system response regulator